MLFEANKEDHKAKRAEYMRRWRTANKERLSAARRQKYADDPNWAARNARRVEATRITNAKRRVARKLFIDHLKDNPCSDCGGIFPPECMDFDHVHGRKVFQIGRVGTLRLESIIEEIAKCELVCANCHRIRTRQRKQHGYGRVSKYAA